MNNPTTVQGWLDAGQWAGPSDSELRRATPITHDTVTWVNEIKFDAQIAILDEAADEQIQYYYQPTSKKIGKFIRLRIIEEIPIHYKSFKIVINSSDAKICNLMTKEMM